MSTIQQQRSEARIQVISRWRWNKSLTTEIDKIDVDYPTTTTTTLIAFIMADSDISRFSEGEIESPESAASTSLAGSNVSVSDSPSASNLSANSSNSSKCEEDEDDEHASTDESITQDGKEDEDDEHTSTDESITQHAPKKKEGKKRAINESEEDEEDDEEDRDDSSSEVTGSMMCTTNTDGGHSKDKKKKKKKKKKKTKPNPKIRGIDPDILRGICARAVKRYKEEMKDPKAFDKKHFQDDKPVKPCIFVKDDADRTSKKDKIREMDRSDVELKKEARDVDGTDFKYGTPKKEDSIRGKDVLECSFSELAHRKREENKDGAADKESTVDSAAQSDHPSNDIADDGALDTDGAEEAEEGPWVCHECGRTNSYHRTSMCMYCGAVQ